MTVMTAGLDLAKDVFQVHGISETSRKIFNKKIKRAKRLAFFLKACSHAWSVWKLVVRPNTGAELQKLGHEVRLMPAVYVKTYVKREKTWCCMGSVRHGRSDSHV